MERIKAAVRLWCVLALSLVLGTGIGLLIGAAVGGSHILIVAEIIGFSLVCQGLVACWVCGVFTLSDETTDEPLGIGA